MTDAVPQPPERGGRSLGGRIALGEAGVLAAGHRRAWRALGWMCALFAVAFAILWSQTVILPRLPGASLLSPAPLAAASLTTLAAYLVYAVLIRRGERRAPGEIALRPLPGELGLGLAIGAAMMLLVVAILIASGADAIAYKGGGAIAGAFWASLLTGADEELVFRLIVFRLLMRAFGAWPALLVSAAIFGGLHLANPHASLVAALAIAVEAGLMLAAFYLMTGRIWVSVGVHAGWNFTQGPILGAVVSGHAGRAGVWLTQPRPGAPELLSGGAFGPEASLPAMAVGLAVFLATLAVMRRGFRRVQAEPWREAAAL